MLRRGHREPVHRGGVQLLLLVLVVVPLHLRRAVRGLFAEAVVQFLQELEALARHRAVVGAEERVDEHAGGGEPGGRGGHRRGRRRRDFGRRGHAAVVLRGRQSQHRRGALAVCLSLSGTREKPPLHRGGGGGGGATGAGCTDAL